MFPVWWGLCGQGRGSCSMYPSWSLILILIWSWILIRLRNGETLSPVQTFRIPAESKRRRRVRITPSKKTSSNVNKSNYQGVLLWEKQGGTIYNKAQNTKIYFGYWKKKSKAKNKNKTNKKSFGSPNTKWHTKPVTTENIQKRHSILKRVKTNSLRMQISQLTRHCHHTIGAIFDSSFSSSCLS